MPLKALVSYQITDNFSIKRDEWISMTISTMQNAINEHGIICDDILAKPMTFNNDIEKNDNEVPF
jgi:hypothetical protein